VISVIANVVPADMAGLVDAFAAGDIKKAMSLHHKMSALMEALFIEVNPVPVKAALALMGKIQEEYRLPLCKMSDTNREKLKKVMTNYSLI
ncbi:MAG TPA: 4-hydroxy-tetrahydrodipicolinate synthase, partial [Deltaproteobacteria bacterium]|nr:4-hydroxy-tetrahydrodipicolinate synthase [Deltaproteobacteria bacterium]